LYAILFYNLFVTIWCKDNKLIIYLYFYPNLRPRGWFLKIAGKSA
jgi:hypothetical protein